MEEMFSVMLAHDKFWKVPKSINNYFFLSPGNSRTMISGRPFDQWVAAQKCTMAVYKWTGISCLQPWMGLGGLFLPASFIAFT